MRNLFKLIATALCIFGSNAALAQNQTIGMMTGSAGSTTALLGEELSRTLSGSSDVRVRSMLGKGSQQNIDDLLYLRGVDFAFLNTDVMINLRITEPDHPALDNLAYLTKITDAELHLVVRNDSDVSNMFDLAGRRISIGSVGSGTALTSRLILRMLGIQSTGIFLDPASAIVALLDEEIDAVFLTGAKPLPILQNITAEDDLRLVEVPFNDQMASIYNAAQFTSDDYPNLVRDKVVVGLSVPVVLAVYNKFSKNSARYKNITAFSDEFMSVLPRLQQPPRHPKWRELDLDAEVRGWTRFEYFEDLIENRG